MSHQYHSNSNPFIVPSLIENYKRGSSGSQLRCYDSSCLVALSRWNAPPLEVKL